MSQQVVPKATVDLLKAENAALRRRAEVAELVIAKLEDNRNCCYCKHAEACLEAIGGEEVCSAYFTPIATAEIDAAKEANHDTRTTA